MMPLPWKKTKIDRVSRFVADLRSTKRGDSLVVQTGFPTSLIDLFVKNRGRLKKPCSKKKQQCPSEIAADPTPPSLICTSDLNSLDSARLQVSYPPVINENTENEIGEEVLPLVVAKNSEEDFVEVLVPNRAFLIMLKLFFMLILALSTKKLTIGITVSAFLLLFLEFSGRHLFRFFNPCSDARRSLNSVVENVLDSVEESSVEANEFSFTEDGGSLTNEIESIESDSKTLLNSKSRSEFHELGQKVGVLGKDEEDAIEDESGSLRNPRKIGSAKIKAKLLKKFVTKTFRGGSKRRRKRNEEPLPDTRNMVSDFNGEDEDIIRVEEQQGEDDQGDQEEEGGGEKEVGELYNSSNVLQSGFHTDVGDNVGRTRNWRLGHLIPFVIILAGLTGGRLIALVLTISWCILKKIRANYGEKQVSLH